MGRMLFAAKHVICRSRGGLSTNVKKGKDASNDKDICVTETFVLGDVAAVVRSHMSGSIPLE